MIIFKALIVVLALFELAPEAFANEVIGCGGFIKSNTEINYKIIKVKLLTKDRVVKYTTEASPVNGYYMIPVYTKGEYILQVNPPPGWSFEPNEIEVNVDGVNDACSKNEDTNFFFKGFGLSGKVVTHGDARMNGPSDIKLKLISKDKVIDSTVSGKDGNYYFSNIMPGAYQIEAEHDSIKFLNKKVSVVLSKENWSSKENIIVSGYKIEGRVTTVNNNPVKNARVELHFNDDSYKKIETKQFVCDLSSESSLRVCHVQTDANGVFSFLNIAFGKYKLVASLESGEMTFAMKPDSLSVDVTTHKDLSIGDSFLLDKVSIKSGAFLGKDKPIQNGEIYINGQKSSDQINKNGQFTLTGLSSGKYKIEIKSSKVYFQEKIVNIDLTKSATIESGKAEFERLHSLTKFEATAFDVCGQVTVIKDQNIEDLGNSIKIKCYSEVDRKLVKSVSLGKNLDWCMALNSNTNYVIKAELTDSKLAKILKLVPFEKKITVSDSPISNINFGQLEAKLDAKITLLLNPNQQAPNDLVITLKSEDTSEKWSKDIPLKCVDSVCKFSLTNLLFGDYILTTNYDDLFCWKGQKKISITSEIQQFELVQSGFLLNYQLSHKNAKLSLNGLNKEIKSNSDLNGVFCLPQAKDYSVTIDSCHKYTESSNDIDSIEISKKVFQKNANKVSFKASRVRVDFQVLFKFDDMKQMVSEKDLYVEAVGDDEKIEMVDLKQAKKGSNELLFTGRGWFAPNQKMRFIARSKKILFEENSKSLKINENDCNDNMIKFEAKLGIFITGIVKPNNLENIELTLTSTDDQAVLEKSSIKNSFKLGPLKAPHTLYNVDLVKSGYLFSKKLVTSQSMDTVEYEFSAEKLGQLKVNVVDKKLGLQLENVLLSLSSENRQFRQNYKTDANGETSFDNLKPGLYYLIVMRQEYEFSPNSHPIRITDGEQMVQKIEAERIAYSCLGKVTSINGQAENGIQIEASGIYNTKNNDADSCAQNQESAVVENGHYHIFNLKPKCEYALKLKSFGNEKTLSSRVIPETYSFTVAQSDIVEQNFILLDSIEKVDVSMGVAFRPLSIKAAASTLNYYVKVKLFKMNQPDSAIQTSYAPANAIVYFNSLPRNPNQQYSVQICLLATSEVFSMGSMTQQQQNKLSQLPVIESVEVGFLADNPHKHLSASFNVGKKGGNFFDLGHKQQQYQNFYMTLPLFIVILGILLNSKSVQRQLFSCKNFIDSKGGLVKAVQSSFQPAPVPSTPRSGRSQRNHHNKKLINSDSSANDSDMERSTKYASRQTTSESVFAQDKGEIDNYEIINNEDVMDMQISNRKQRVKKSD